MLTKIQAIVLSSIFLILLIIGPVYGEPTSHGWLAKERHGWNRGRQLNAVALETDESCTAIDYRSNPEENADIKELAASLECEPALIYDYVHNNIDYVPYFGAQKGALLTYLDGSGNDFDQASLMVAMLRACSSMENQPHSIENVQFIPRRVNMSLNDMAKWVGLVSNDGTVANETTTLTELYKIPIPYFGEDALDGSHLYSIYRVWIRATIDNVQYEFDPAYKTYEYIPASLPDIGKAVEYSRDDFIALSGITTDTVETPTFIQNVNEAKIQDKLTEYAKKLVTIISNDYPGKELSAIIGGRRIVKAQIKAYSEAMPWATAKVNDVINLHAGNNQIEEAYWTDIPQYYKASLTIKHEDNDTKSTAAQKTNAKWCGIIYVPDIAGKVISMTYGKSDSKIKMLLDIDGTKIYGGIVRAYANYSLKIQMRHGHYSLPDLSPLYTYMATKNWPYVPDYGADREGTTHVFSGKTKKDSYYSYGVIMNFGGMSELLLYKYQKKLNDALARGESDNSPKVRATTLALMGQTYMKESNMADRLLSSLTNLLTITYHNIAIVGQEKGYSMDAFLCLSGSVLRSDAGDDARHSNFRAGGVISSALEYGAFEQVVGPGKPMVSTTRLLHLANTNISKDKGLQLNKIFLVDTKDAFDDLGKKKLLFGYTAQVLETIGEEISKNGHAVVLPQAGNLGMTGHKWRGYGYIAFKDDHVYTGIGGKNGVHSFDEDEVDAKKVAEESEKESSGSDLAAEARCTKDTPETGEPVDLASGAYVYDSTDISIGGAAPAGLSFSRFYDSGQKSKNSYLGYGWTHNYDIYISTGSSGDAGLGGRQPVEAAAALTALFISNDILKWGHPETGLSKKSLLLRWVLSAVISNWAVDQLTNNMETLHFGNKVMQFIKLPNGEYSSPPGSTAQLREEETVVKKKTINTLYVLERGGSRMDFDTSKRIKTITDEEGRQLTFNYKNKLLENVKDAFDRTLTFTYKRVISNGITLNYIKTVADSPVGSTGRVVSYDYKNNNLVSYTDLNKKKWLYCYGMDDATKGTVTTGTCGTEKEEDVAKHRLVGIINPRNILSVVNYYNDFDKVVKQTFPRKGKQGNKRIEYYIYVSDYRGAEKNPFGYKNIYYFDNKGRDVRMERRDNAGDLVYAEEKGYDAHDRLRVYTDMETNITRFDYDGEQNLTGVTNALGQVTTYKYDPGNSYRLTDMIGPLKRGAVYEYDPDNKNRLASVTKYVFNEDNSRDSAVKAKDGPQLEIEKDIKASYEYHTELFKKGLVSKVKDARDRQIETDYDKYGNPTFSQHTSQLNGVTFGYDSDRSMDKRGWMTSLEDQGKVKTLFDYYDDGKIKTITDPLGKATSISYYDDGTLWQKTDRNLIKAEITPTPSGKVDKITYYDTKNNPSTLLAEVSYTYNDHDQLETMVDSLGTTSYTYNSAGNVENITNNAKLKINGVEHPFADLTVTHKYYASGNLKELTYPNDNKVKYTYDALNRLKTVTIVWTGNPETHTATYNYKNTTAALDNSVAHFNGLTTTYGFDNADRLTSIGSTIASYTFTVDPNGNIREAERADEVMSAFPADDPGTIYTYGYNDPAQPKNNRLISEGSNSYLYDDEGQLKTAGASQYVFDYAHRLSSAGDQLSNYYDGSGKRILSVRNGIITRYIYDKFGNLIAEADGNNVITGYYIYGAGLLAKITSTGEIYNYHFNQIGSTVAITDKDQTIVNKYSYDPFGSVLEETEGIDQPFKFVGQFGVMAEDNGLYYMRARYYDAKIGRFIREDPIGFEGGDVNLYAYAGNNPVNGIDPSGLFEIFIRDTGGRNGDTYGAVFIVTGNNGVVAIVRGSTWPNPNNSNPGIAAGTYNAVYSDTGHKGITNGVRLENGASIPTLGPNPAQHGQDIATGINIHRGDSLTNRGSAGCLTIDPQQSSQVWDILENGETGTVTVSRKP